MNVFIGGSKTRVDLFTQHKLRYQVTFAGRTQLYNWDTALLSLLIATCQSLTLPFNDDEPGNKTIYLFSYHTAFSTIALLGRNDLFVKQNMTG